VLNLETEGKFLSNFSAYNARWAMPADESGGVLAMWFSFDYADVHFVSIDTSTDFPGAPEGETGDSHMPWFRKYLRDARPARPRPDRPH
jgi:hypothetical protein